MTLTALCAAGLEPIVARELEHLGFKPSEREHGRVTFESDAAGAAKALIGLRTAERLMARLGRFALRDFDDLYEGIRTLPWEDFANRDDAVTIARIRVRDSGLSARTSVQSVAHKAVYDRLSARYRLARLPETGEVREIRLYIENDECTAGIDLSGDNLSRRGYRKRTAEAPLRETLAAAMVLLAAWRRKYPLYDPLCGSGTIPIEAALYAMDKAPGLDRTFGLETMPGCPREAFRSARESARAAVRKDVRVRIFGSDNDPRALELAGANAVQAGVDGVVDFSKRDMETALPAELEGVGDDAGFLIANPPWGGRLGTPGEAHETWKLMGSLRGRFPGWAMGFIADDESFPEHFGAMPDRSWAISSGMDTLRYFLWRQKEREGGPAER